MIFKENIRGMYLQTAGILVNINNLYLSLAARLDTEAHKVELNNETEMGSRATWVSQKRLPLSPCCLCPPPKTISVNQFVTMNRSFRAPIMPRWSAFNKLDVMCDYSLNVICDWSLNADTLSKRRLWVCYVKQRLRWLYRVVRSGAEDLLRFAAMSTDRGPVENLNT